MLNVGHAWQRTGTLPSAAALNSNQRGDLMDLRSRSFPWRCGRTATSRFDRARQRGAARALRMALMLILFCPPLPPSWFCNHLHQLLGDGRQHRRGNLKPVTSFTKIMGHSNSAISASEAVPSLASRGSFRRAAGRARPASAPRSRRPRIESRARSSATSSRKTCLSTA
jgi:hypothetical protein